MNHEFSSSSNRQDNEYLGAPQETEQVQYFEFPDTKSKDWVCNMYVDEIARTGHKQEAADYIGLMAEVECASYQSGAEFRQANPDYVKKMHDSLSSAEILALTEYTTRSYQSVNTVLRGNWYYETMGPQTEEAEESLRDLARTINDAIDKAPVVEEDFIAYRGVNVDTFKSYGVSSIEEMSKMEGQFYLQRAFSSTSVTREGSYAGRESFEDTSKKPCNVEMRYRVPAGTNEGIFLDGRELTTQNRENTEYLLRSGALAFVNGVTVSEDGKSAVMDCTLIPHRLTERERQ